MNLKQLFQKIDSEGGAPSAKPLLQKLIKRGEAGFPMAHKQARNQIDSATLLKLGFALWEDGVLTVNPQVIEELRH